MFAQNLFKDKIALITGGGSGIGFEIAKQFLTYGAKVYIASRKPERLEKAIAELKTFGTCYSFVLDIRDIEQVSKTAQLLKEKEGHLDILINNAGGQFPSPAENISINGWNAVINNNLNGSWYMTQTFAKEFFIPQKNGTILTVIANIERGFPGMTHTGAARAGIDNFTKSLAIEWAQYHIRINAVAPGVIDSSGLEQYPPDILKSIKGSIPVRKTGTVQDVAYLTLFLCSDMANYITGETVYVDGGQRLWGSMWQIPDTF